MPHCCAPEAHPGKPCVCLSRYAESRTYRSAIIAAQCSGGSIATSVLVTLAGITGTLKA